ncbi:hypothetical protein BU24DRAFT_429164 [Aaosphaeria arxii CBS 175.79]|uniref:Uncharacterized protein n=1 Tax=Aaosphaeria arxii CBS 175.79 TaxID=1450172 RepID=A0A6A5X6F7_9PLEO|nr:uncharacterized protein BU24DRAFT_429164 [Aaosphaeria arxii CBS 175.79]KAF2008568.1 hypothetical protein BU24DRAFT_429164 [Aaosphaeria arxii CBS 175.79]
MDPSTLPDLILLRRQYFQLVEPIQLRWPDFQVLKRPEVQDWIYRNMFDSSIESAPPDRYKMRVLKPLISKLERTIENPEEDVWSLLSLISSIFFFSMIGSLSVTLGHSQISNLRKHRPGAVRFTQVSMHHSSIYRSLSGFPEYLPFLW